MSLHLTHWGRATHICVDKLTTIGSDNGLSPGRRQAIIWTNAGILLIGSLGTNFSEILIGIQTFSFKKMHLKMSSAKWRPSCLGLNVLRAAGCQKIWFAILNDVIQSKILHTISLWQKNLITLSQNHACCWFRTRESAGAVVTHFERCELYQIIFQS